eukprot:scaffold13230_cov98-Isochrysis_galbana.AAC.9
MGDHPNRPCSSGEAAAPTRRARTHTSRGRRLQGARRVRLAASRHFGVAGHASAWAVGDGRARGDAGARVDV